MTKKKCFLAGLLPLLYLAALTSRVSLAIPDNTPEFIETQIENPKLVGKGQYHRFFWEIYEAGLYASEGVYSPEKNFALLIEYKRNLSGNAIAEKSIELIAAQGVNDREKLEQWGKFLHQVIPDVRDGDRIAGISADNAAYFYFNGELLGQTRDPQFRHYFFSIWLGEDTTAPELRQDLLGSSLVDRQE